MKDKVVRLTKALSNESVRRLPYILLVFAVLLLFQGYLNGRKSATNTTILRQNSSDTKVLLSRVADLTEDNKRLQQQAIDLQEKSNDQLACVSNLFIDFINSGRALTKADAAKCSVTVVGTGQNQPTASQRGTTNLVGGVSSSSSSKSAPKAPPGQSNKSQQPSAPPANSSLFDRVIYTPVTNFLKGALGVQ